MTDSLLPPSNDKTDDELFPSLTQANPNAFAEAQALIPRHRQIFHFLAADLAQHIAVRLGELGKNARWLAQQLGKRDSEISKWLSGSHNLTLDSVAKITDILGEDLLVSPRFATGFFGQATAISVVEARPARLVTSFGNLTTSDDASALAALKWTVSSGDDAYATAA